MQILLVPFSLHRLLSTFSLNIFLALSHFWHSRFPRVNSKSGCNQVMCLWGGRDVQAAVEELDKAESQGGGLAGVFTCDKIPLSRRKLGSDGLWP